MSQKTTSTNHSTQASSVPRSRTDRVRILATLLSAGALIGSLASCGSSPSRVDITLAQGARTSLTLKAATLGPNGFNQDVQNCLLAFPDLTQTNTVNALQQLDISGDGVTKSGSQECSANINVFAHVNAVPASYQIRIVFTYVLANGVATQNGNSIVVQVTT